MKSALACIAMLFFGATFARLFGILDGDPESSLAIALLFLALVYLEDARS